jgi:hypothetical protein
VPYGFLLTKLNPAGETNWQSQFVETNETVLSVSQLNVSSNGNIYISAIAMPNFYQTNIAVVAILLSSNGAVSSIFRHKLVWENRYQNNSYYPAMANDNLGNICLSGVLMDNDRSGAVPLRTNQFAFTKLDSQGHILWSSRPESPSDGIEPRLWATDSRNNLCLSGLTAHDPTFQEFWYSQLTTAKFDPNGNQVWSTNFNYLDLEGPYSLFIERGDTVLVSGSFYLRSSQR